MVRPRKCRMVGASPNVTYFKPRGVPLNRLIENHLSVEGFEAVRLADYLGLRHAAAAEKMQVSRQTFGRTLSKARQTVAKALVDGTALRIRGGDYLLNARQHPSSDHPATQQSHEHAVADATPLEAKEADMPKIAISCEGPSLEDALDPRFGRAAGFIIVDSGTSEFEYIDNGASQTMSQGAGIQAAEQVAASGAQVVLTGYVGPKAFRALNAVGIRIGQDLGNITVRQALECYNSGQVAWAEAPNRRGHGR